MDGYKPDIFYNPKLTATKRHEVTPEEERSLLALAALTKLHDYIQDKDIAGECMLRTVTNNADSDHVQAVRFYFEFPQEYQSMCTQVFLPEALEVTKDLDFIHVEILPHIEAKNRLHNDGEDKCGILFEFPAQRWLFAASFVLNNAMHWLTQAAQGVCESIGTELTSMMYNLVNQLSLALTPDQAPVSDDHSAPNFVAEVTLE